MNRVIGALLCGVIGFAGCTVEVSTKAESPTRVAVATIFRPFKAVGNDTLDNVVLYGIDVAGVHFDSLDANDTTQYLETKQSGLVSLSIDSAVARVHFYSDGGFPGTYPITIYDIEPLEVTLIENNRNVVVLDSVDLAMGDWLQGTRVSIHNQLEGIRLSTGDSIVGADLFGVMVGDTSIGNLAAGDTTLYFNLESKGTVVLAIDSMHIASLVCLGQVACNEQSFVFTDIEPMTINVLPYRKSRIIIDSQSPLIRQTLGKKGR
jgi:hypothetical protein